MRQQPSASAPQKDTIASTTANRPPAPHCTQHLCCRLAPIPSFFTTSFASARAHIATSIRNLSESSASMSAPVRGRSSPFGKDTKATPSNNNVIAVRNVSLTTLMKKRAHDQFASVKAGKGAIPTGQRSTADATGLKPTLSSPSRSVQEPKISAPLRKKPSAANLKNTKDTETSATGAPRTLRAKPSSATLKVGGAPLHVASPNVPPTSRADHEPLAKPLARESLQSRTVRSAKQQHIADSPVLSAMLRAKLPQKTITATTTHNHQSKSTAAFEGGGMRVKATPSRGASNNASVVRKTPASGQTIRIKANYSSGTSQRNPPLGSHRTPIISQTFTPSRTDLSAPKDASKLVRPVTMKSSYTTHDK